MSYYEKQWATNVASKTTQIQPKKRKANCATKFSRRTHKRNRLQSETTELRIPRQFVVERPVLLDEAMQRRHTERRETGCGRRLMVGGHGENDDTVRNGGQKEDKRRKSAINRPDHEQEKA